ncbi:hypothetical protein FOLKNPGA_03406 [Legionella sp. PC1000]|nr:hypothetical protein FOLKNPGA_03406 [Legionella sp. PC1000]
MFIDIGNKHVLYIIPLHSSVYRKLQINESIESDPIDRSTK